MLVADECWIMIDPRVPQSLQFLRNVEKRARKYEGSVVVGTQSIVDFLDPSVKMYGQSVLDLPSIKLLFGSDGQSLEETRNLFHLNDAQYDLIASKQRGLALMKIGSQAVKVRFEFSDARLARQLRSITNATDFNAFMADYPDDTLEYTDIIKIQFTDDTGIDNIDKYEENLQRFLFMRASEQLSQYTYTYEEVRIDGKPAEVQTLVVLDNAGDLRCVERRGTRA